MNAKALVRKQDHTFAALYEKLQPLESDLPESRKERLIDLRMALIRQTTTPSRLTTEAQTNIIDDDAEAGGTCAGQAGAGTTPEVQQLDPGLPPLRRPYSPSLRRKAKAGGRRAATGRANATVPRAKDASWGSRIPSHRA